MERDDKSEEDEERDIHESLCDQCKEGGDLICCDACVKVGPEKEMSSLLLESNYFVCST